MSSGLMIDDIIMNLFTDGTEKTMDSVQKHLFSQIQDETIHLYKVSLQDFTWGKKLIQKRYYVHIISLKKKRLRKYLFGILSIDTDEVDLEKKTNQFINDISDFNNKHIIQCYNKTKSNIPEELRYKIIHYTNWIHQWSI